MIKKNQIEFSCINCSSHQFVDSRKDLKCSCGNIDNEQFIIFSLNKIENISVEHLLKFRRNRRGEFIPERVDVDGVVLWLMQNYKFKTIYGSKHEDIYFYNLGLWNKRGRKEIETETERVLGKWATTNIIREVIGKIKRKSAIDFEEFNVNPLNLIPLKNGVYNIETEKLEEHNPEHYFKFRVSTNYNLKAECPAFLTFLDETIYPEHYELIQEWFGFCLYRKYLFKNGMIWFGGRDTGKTTLFSILEGFVGIENCSGLSLQDIKPTNKFQLKFLHDKMLNSYDDLSSADISDTGGFKIVTGGGSITGEHKFGDDFKFINFAKLLFTCNTIPSPKEINDDAYFSRWLPIPFDNQVAIKNQDENFAVNCLKNESEGILNWALVGLKRLLKNRKFSYDKTSDEIKIIMMRTGNPIINFIETKCSESVGADISKDKLFECYEDWARENKIPIMVKRAFGSAMIRFCNYVIDGNKKTPDGRNTRCWRNIKVW